MGQQSEGRNEPGRANVTPTSTSTVSARPGMPQRQKDGTVDKPPPLRPGDPKPPHDHKP